MSTAIRLQPVLIDGQWVDSDANGSFQATNPQTGDPLDPSYPVSGWSDCERALAAAVRAFHQLGQISDDRRAAFLERFAARIEQRADDITEIAHLETALPASPRLKDVELPRTTNQLRLAATAAREGSWRKAAIDTATNIRSGLIPIGPVAVFGPNNFPLAFNSVSGGDFAAAIAAGNPVIGKANSSHPGTTRLLAEEAQQAADDEKLPPGTIQLLYRLEHADGERLVADTRLAATGYTGSQQAGLALKRAADAAGIPIFLEMSSINPVILLPGALHERSAAIAEEFAGSCLLGAGQFCTNPGLVIVVDSEESAAWIADVAKRFNEAPVGTLLSAGVESSLRGAIDQLQQAGAERLTHAGDAPDDRFCCANALLQVSGRQFLEHPRELQTEAFGNASLIVVAANVAEISQIVEHLEGNLTGAVYSASDGSDDAAYNQLEPPLRRRVGRLLNDKMPTGVAVSPAMNHGGPFPATGSPQFTAVGVPASLERFSMLACYDNVRAERLPAWLQDKNPSGAMWRNIDGAWTRGHVRDE